MKRILILIFSAMVAAAHAQSTAENSDVVKKSGVTDVARPRNVIAMQAPAGPGFNTRTSPPTAPDDKQAPTMRTILAQGPASIKLFGAAGDGTQDDAPAINAAFAYVLAGNPNARGLYFPCGTYKTMSSLSLYVPANTNAPYLIGESQGCVYIKYEGSAAIEAVLKVTSDPNQYVQNFSARDIGLLGNAVTTYDLELINPAQTLLTNIRMWGANPSNGACFYMTSAVEVTLLQPICNRSPTPYTSLPFPQNGLIFDGVGVLGGGVPTVVIGPEVTYVTGKALWVKSNSLLQISGCQINTDGVLFYLEDTTQSVHIDSCLFEGTSGKIGAQTGNSRLGGSSNYITNSTITSQSNFGVEVHGLGQVLKNVYIASAGGHPLEIHSGAVEATLEDIKLRGGTVSLVDLGTGTRITNMKADNSASATVQDSVNTAINPLFNWNGIAGNTRDSTTEIRGAFHLQRANTILTPTVFTPGKSWRAIFLGEWQDFSGKTSTQNIAPYIELTETNNVIHLPQGNAVTFSVNASGQFQAASSASCCEVFQGSILFIPNLTPVSTTGASGPNSMSLSGTIRLGAEPTEPSQAATKQYVDSNFDAGFTGIKTLGNCTLTIKKGLITGVTGC